MPLSLQAKLLRVLQDQKIQRIGDDKSIPVNVRIIAATNVDLIERVKSKQFREDLFYRLHVIPIHLPPLRKRKVDLLDLTNDLINDYSERTHKQLTLSAEVKQLFINYDWPGNIRELHNVLEYAFVMANDGERISKSHLPNYMLESSSHTNDQTALTNIELYLKTNEIEKAAIVEALQLSNNNRTKAMKLLNMSRKSFYHKLKHYNLTECIR
ncbi:acetoacetate metabolism regulatory protein AtoC [Geomicrobium sp. JCM 19055]|nr:acetoacetate metabolism regulatory protein AtoC [Geomicrobium sp. JCM 19055]